MSVHAARRGCPAVEQVRLQTGTSPVRTRQTLEIRHHFVSDLGSVGAA
jgi:hypothetical protein